MPKQPPREFQFLAYFYSDAVMNNIFAGNDFLNGQTVGRLFGGNTTTTAGFESFFMQQRLIPFFIFQPKLLDGRALLRASFEIDWTWGDRSYGTGGNTGGAFSADQVNIQTQNIEVELIPYPGLTVNLGLQRLFDTPYNPYRTFFSTMTYTGYRLAFWGSDAAGITLRYDRDFTRFKLGYYQLYENRIQERDDVGLWEFMAERDLTPTWRQGVSLWYVNDRGNGQGGVSILGQGLNSLLNDYNGVFRFPLGNTPDAPYKADIFWIGTFWHRNPEFTLGRWMLTGFGITNRGKVRVESGDEEQTTDIAGYAANLRLGYRHGQTAEDVVTVDLLYASGDGDTLRDGQYSGIITGNTYGSPGAIFISHGAYLLLPHGNVVNRFVAAVNDLSNIGLGFLGGTVNVYKSLIPHKLSVKVGAAAAVSEHAPPEGGKTLGREINARIRFQPRVFMDVEVHAAYLWLGDFYTSSAVNGKRERRTDPPMRTEKPHNPWTVLLTFKWLMF
ncbi:MAG: hypothetical protein D6681_05610 [Calditrichaeota bacterium]|nr:MAG: hypothetical protein D6681_05610 [Calditrichota bacterium]